MTSTMPAAPVAAREHGLPFDLLLDLVLKLLFQGGRQGLRDLAHRVCLPAAAVEPPLAFLRAERLCEAGPPRSAHPLADLQFQLTAEGRQHAAAALEKCGYVGPAPVPLDDYAASVTEQSARLPRPSRTALHGVFRNSVVPPSLLDDLGTALHAGRPVLLYGPSGSGKTFLAEHLAASLEGTVRIPHAICVAGEIVSVFDPLVHRAVPVPAKDSDPRWVACRRPVVMCGGELTLAGVDLQYDATQRFYAAPPQVKANNGLLVIDDLGRQQVSPQDLMNRWIVPLDRRTDHFVLHTGRRFALPFHLNLVFSSNLGPDDLADAAFLRRLGYKIAVSAASLADYRRLFDQACARNGLPPCEAAFEHLTRRLHDRDCRPLLACTPHDLLGMIRDRADYAGRPPQLTPDELDWAWQTYFAATSSPASPTAAN